MKPVNIGFDLSVSNKNVLPITKTVNIELKRVFDQNFKLFTLKEHIKNLYVLVENK